MKSNIPTIKKRETPTIKPKKPKSSGKDKDKSGWEQLRFDFPKTPAINYPD